VARVLPVYEAPVDPAARSLGLLLVAVLGLIMAFVTIFMAFSTLNTPHSMNGDKNTQSQWIETD
jgi:hypothetical protein